jgi:hypothetical protein
MKRFDEAELNLFPNEMAVNFYVFSSLMIDQILGYVNGCLTITVQRSYLWMGNKKILVKRKAIKFHSKPRP